MVTLRELREAVGLTQAQVAKKLVVDQGAVSNWERGINPPSRKYHKKLAKLYGCSVDDLLEGNKCRE